MKLRLPKYYKEFKCIASECKDSCCSAGWEIDIDNDSIERYKKVNGEFGKKLMENIKNEENPYFILNKNGTCPFLNSKKLCEIYLNLGKESLCKICTEHPRYYEYFKNIKEGGIGLCCEEAARIIMTQTEKFSTYDVEIPNETTENYDIKLNKYLFNAREKIFMYLENNEIPLNSRLCSILWFSNVIQQNIDSNLLDEEEIFEVNSYTTSNLKSILEFLLTLEVNDLKWTEYIKHSINTYEIYKNKMKYFENDNPQISNYLKNIANYFIWRYFLKGTFDKDVLSKTKLMVVSVAVIKSLLFCEWIEKQNITLDDCINVAKKYSEEIEYSENNLYSLADASYNLDIFDTENLLGLLKE